MDIRSYIQCCIDSPDVAELNLTWHYTGESTCTNETRFYKNGNLYRINVPESTFNNQLFYCDADYIGTINWTEVTTLDEANQTTLKNGLTATCFTFFNQTVNLEALPDFISAYEADLEYKPLTKYAEVSNLENILIDDDQYYQIMQIVGQPFIKDRELEYKRQAILKLAVEPALKTYYTYYPLIQEQVLPHRTGDYMIPYPTKPYPAYKAVAWISSAGSMMRGTLGVEGMSPLAALGTDVSLYTRTATGGKFATGLHYSKAVPGFTGESATDGGGALSQLSTAWPLANTLKNITRRERLQKIHVPGKGLFAKGYSSLSGYLNIVWLCWSRDFNDVDFEDWTKVIQLCQSYVKVSIGSIRELLKMDSNVPFKEGMQKEGQAEINKWIEKAEQDPYRLIYTTERGGVL